MSPMSVLGRLVDLVDDGAGGVAPVYAADPPPGCGPPDTGLMLLVDLIDDGSGGVVPVYAQVTPCQKDWVETEAYVGHDTGGLVVRLSREVTVLVTGMEDCTADGSACPEATLVYDEGLGRWAGELALNNGTAAFEFYGVFNGVDVDWFLDLGGCLASSGGPGPVAAPLTPDCGWPPRWTGIGGGGPFTGDNCCLASPPPSILYVLGKVPPVYLGRLVDLLPDGSGGAVPVYATSESCDLCVGSQGCCPGVPVDDEVEYTYFNVANATPGCACSGPADSGSPRADSCETWGFTSPGCTAPQTCCLVCVPGDVGDRSWENYRLLVEGTLYEPSSGSCDPFSVTFDGVPWETADPGGACSGTLSITATRP